MCRDICCSDIIVAHMKTFIITESSQFSKLLKKILIVFNLQGIICAWFVPDPAFTIEVMLPMCFYFSLWPTETAPYLCFRNLVYKLRYAHPLVCSK